MPERAEVFESVQVGVENRAAKGAAVAATKALTSIGIEAGPELESSEYRPRGRKLNTIVTPGRRWTGGSLSGRLTYTEIVYFLASLYGYAAPATPVGATAAREWPFGMNPTGPDDYQSYTVEIGSSVRSARFKHGTVTDLGIDFGTEEIAVDGSIIGQ